MTDDETQATGAARDATDPVVAPAARTAIVCRRPTLEADADGSPRPTRPSE